MQSELGKLKSAIKKLGLGNNPLIASKKFLSWDQELKKEGIFLTGLDYASLPRLGTDM